MIHKIELWLNIIHYCLYKAESRRYYWSNKLNPFMLLGRIPSIKRKFEEQGTSHTEVVDRVWNDDEFGFGIMISGGVMVVLVTFLFWGLVSTVLGYLEVYFFVKPIYVFIYAILSYALCHFTIFKGNKYIKHLKKLDKRSKSVKWRYAFFTFLFVIGSMALWLYSFRFLPKF